MMHDLGFDDRAESSHISPSKPLFGFIPIQHESMLIRSTDSMMLLPPPQLTLGQDFTAVFARLFKSCH